MGDTVMPTISVIVPTIGRPSSLVRLLDSLAGQSHPVDEVIIADGSGDNKTRAVVVDRRWSNLGLEVKHVTVQPPHAVRQREAAIEISRGETLLLLDDDVALETDCVEKMIHALAVEDAIAVMADLNNQAWAMPTKAWRMYLWLFHGLTDGRWQGRVVGPLLRYGFSPVPLATVECEWFATGNTLISRRAFDLAGGFSSFFLHRSTMNEDVDLSLRMAKQGRILFCPEARLGHFHDPAGRVTVRQAAEDDLFNRYHVLLYSADRSRFSAYIACMLFFCIESFSNLLGAFSKGWLNTGERLKGRASALWRILVTDVAT